MTTSHTEALDLKPGSRGGRRDRDGGEETIKIKPIKDSAKEVMRLMRRADDAKTELSDAIKALAERSGTNASNLKRLFKASFKGNFTDVRRDVDQQSVLFEQVGEIATGAVSDAEEKKVVRARRVPVRVTPEDEQHPGFVDRIEYVPDAWPFPDKVKQHKPRDE